MKFIHAPINKIAVESLNPFGNQVSFDLTNFIPTFALRLRRLNPFGNQVSFDEARKLVGMADVRNSVSIPSEIRSVSIRLLIKSKRHNTGIVSIPSEIRSVSIEQEPGRIT